MQSCETRRPTLLAKKDQLVAATHGLGYILSFAQSTCNSALMFALILLILAVVLAIFAIAGRLDRHARA